MPLGRHSLTCPNCRQVTPIPKIGLQSAFHITPLLEVQESLKKLKNPAATLEGAVGGAATGMSSNTELHYCRVHSRRVLDLYCETCEELVCVQCIMKGGKHRDHDHAVIEDAYEKHKADILSAIKPLEQQVAAIERALAQLDRGSDEICDQRTAAEDQIHAAFRKLQVILNVRETELVAKLNKITEGKMKDLAAQRDQVETLLAQRNSCLYFLRESLTTGNRALLLKTKVTVKKINELTPFQLRSWKPSVQANTHVVFTPVSADMPLTTVCQNHGEIVTTELPDPSRCLTSGDGLKAADLGEISTVHLTPITFSRQYTTKSFKSLDCKLTSELLGNCGVEKNFKDYNISYQPMVKGRHQLLIKADGQHIPGSPFSIVVTSPVKELGTLMHTIPGVKGPRGIAINQSGEVVVTEGGAQRVSVFTPGGVKLRSFGESQLMDPGGVTVDGEGNIAVVDMGRRCVLKFTAEGQFVTSVGTEGNGPLQFFSPTDVAFNSRNNSFYVLDMGSSCIQALNSDLTFYKSFGEAGRDVGNFSEKAWGIACDKNGDIYVADTGRNRVHVFSAEGRVLRMFGSRGQGLHFPMGICYGGGYGVCVSEHFSDNTHVSVFTWEGQFLTSFQLTQSHAQDDLDTDAPEDNDFVSSGLAVDDNGLLYVCDYVNDRIQIF